ncbi:hypothetical protein OEZ85_012588 [Tetradesmus obliquus]|uniref:Uncharacterized protein n=2 Tax=Tetradesmus obliquus TaxID=3088 RepID=A0A383WFM2_TETOB|nr:hypothetical protein OEZ85_012588 [Tetradesmus obliquus]|eukprot:jgi/Sobl393_1/9283/SZX75849.1
MALSPYLGNDPFFGQMERALDNAFQRALGGRSGDLMMFPSLLGPSSVPAGSHPMDIVETPAAFELHCDAPGFSPDDISVEMNEGVMTISGKRKEEKREEKDGKVVRRERTMSSFSRSFTLPDNVKDEGVAASLVNGVLKVTVPKAEPKAQPQPKRITVSGGEAA